MIQLTDVQLYSWIAAFIWPLTRILGLFASAPILSHQSLPVTYRVGLGVLITFIVAPNLPPLPEQDPISWIGILILAEQFLIGIAIGFVMTVVFTGFELAGELIGMSMGLSFATFFDPQSQGRSSVINQFMLQMVSLLFLSQNLHLSLIELLVHSFSTLPIEVHVFDRNVLKQIALLGSQIFSVGVQIALPVITAVMLANIALGVLTRAAPQLNIFGIGFPITLGMGYIMLGFILPYWIGPIMGILESSLATISKFAQ